MYYQSAHQFKEGQQLFYTLQEPLKKDKVSFITIMQEDPQFNMILLTMYDCSEYLYIIQLQYYLILMYALLYWLNLIISFFSCLQLLVFIFQPAQPSFSLLILLLQLLIAFSFSIFIKLLVYLLPPLIFLFQQQYQSHECIILQIYRQVVLNHPIINLILILIHLLALLHHLQFLIWQQFDGVSYQGDSTFPQLFIYQLQQHLLLNHPLNWMPIQMNQFL